MCGPAQIARVSDASRRAVCAALFLLVLASPSSAFSLQPIGVISRQHQPILPAGRANAIAVRVPLPYVSLGGGVFLSRSFGPSGLAPLRAGEGGERTRRPSEFNREPGESEIKTFLTQRAFQNLIFLLADLGRDQITADWLEGWRGYEGIRHYHGLSGLHMGGRALIAELLREPNEEVTVEFKRRGNGGHGGSPERAAAMGAGGNPYLQDHVYEFKTKIEPRRLGDRLMRLRQEVADEWCEDLLLLGKENEEMWRSFFETVREDEDKLKDLQMPVYTHDPSESVGSTFRGGNYDLLRRLATLKAIVHLKDEYMRGNAMEQAKGNFLDKMMTVHGSGFEGDAPYHVDKTFLGVLLESTPYMVRSQLPSGEGSMVLLSPISVVEDICQVRQSIAEAWCMELEQVSDDHTAIQRELLQQSLDFP